MLMGTGTLLVDALSVGLKEDCPYGDITTELLGIEGQGKFVFITRVEAVVSGTSRLREFFETQQLVVSAVRQNGQLVKPGEVIIGATGDIKLLFKLWRICQTYLTVLCAIATQTKRLVQAAPGRECGHSDCGGHPQSSSWHAYR